MKKIICLLLMIMLTGAAFAEEPQPAFTGVELKLNEDVQLDLNGDGAMESLVVTMVGVEDEKLLNLFVTGTDGNLVSYETYISRYTGCFAADLDHDGMMEILLSGDEWSWDFATTCLHYTADGQLVPVSFQDAGRFPGDEPYAPFGYGMVTAISDDGKITLTGSQDVLGTWMAECVFELRNGAFHLEENAVWRRMDSMDDPQIWEYASLILKRELPVTMEDGSEGKINPGQRILITETDRESYAAFVCEDGAKGRFPIQREMEYGYGHEINGLFEDEWFEYLPYAD